MDSDFCFICGNLSEDRDDENVIIGLNPIIYCSSCNMGVHLKCVGLAEATEQFICDKCKYLKHGEDPIHLTCAYCASHYGYLFRIHNDPSPTVTVISTSSSSSSSSSSSPTPRFAHLFCQLVYEGGLVKSFSPIQLSPPLVDIVYNGVDCGSTSSLDTIFKVNTMMPAAGGRSVSFRNPTIGRASKDKDTNHSLPFSFSSTAQHHHQQHQYQSLSVEQTSAPTYVYSPVVDRSLTCQFAITGVRNRGKKTASEVKFNDFVVSELVRQENAYISKNKIQNGQYNRTLQ